MPTGVYKRQLFSEEHKRNIGMGLSKPKACIVCNTCNKKFYVHPSRKNKAKYCSHPCYAISLESKSSWNKGKHPEYMQGKNHYKWKGMNASYTSLHKRVYKERGNPSYCEVCKTTKAKRFEWANLTGKYHDTNDYKRMCCKCHNKYDGERRKNEHSISKPD